VSLPLHSTRHKNSKVTQTSNPLAILGVDTGGTFTDFVLYHKQKLTIHKVLSTPHAPEQAILQGIHEMGLDQCLDTLSIVHGSTVATNAALEKKGVKTAYLTNTGLSDILTIGRQARKQLYNLTPQTEAAPVEAHLCFEFNSRVDAKGHASQYLSETELEQLNHFINEQQPESIAINLLFSFLNNEDECKIEHYINTHFPDLFISRSSKILPEYKEYERGIATWLNAWVGPLVKGYLQRLSQAIIPAPLSIMQSSGGTMNAENAADNAVRMLLSGPAGGLAGAHAIAGSNMKILTFDMGGTSTDVAVIEAELQLTSEGHIGDYPVAIPMVDMHTIGAGGGSIASIDEGGILHVGPHSAGATPGPACYNQGGHQATVTDANLVLGRLPVKTTLAGSMPLNKSAAVKAVKSLSLQLEQSFKQQLIEQTALGIIQLANEHMSRALRLMSIQRGIDPKTLILVPFGGAGALHVCALADNLKMSQAMVPIHAGVLSALGMVVAPHSRDLSKTINQLLLSSDEKRLNQQLKKLSKSGIDELCEEGIEQSHIKIIYSLDLRYQGQSYTLNVPWTDLASSELYFHQLHQQRYGHQHGQAIELVNIRAKIYAPSICLNLEPLKQAVSIAEVDYYTEAYGYNEPVPVYQRDNLTFGHTISGPALIVEKVSTTWLENDWQCKVDQLGNLLLHKT